MLLFLPLSVGFVYSYAGARRGMPRLRDTAAPRGDGRARRRVPGRRLACRRPAAPRTGDAVQEFLQKQFHQRKKIYFCKRACAY
jgi:hypothetical protein